MRPGGLTQPRPLVMPPGQAQGPHPSPRPPLVPTGRSHQDKHKAQYISLKDLLTSLRSKRIKQVNKIKKLILRLKWLRWRHIALLRFILVVDLLDLPAVDAQATWWQDGARHLVLQALEQRLGCLFRFQ